MKKELFEGILVSYERRNNSVNGNPRYYGVFENSNGDILRGSTATDASCAYSFLNKREKERELQYHVTKSGNIIIDYITIK